MLTVCAQPSCPELTPGRYCQAHARQQRKATDARRPSSTVRGYDHAWARTRGRYLKHHPVCVEPGCHAPATEAHHLDGRGPAGPDGHRWANLVGLCKRHHTARTKVEQPAGTAAWRSRPPR